jgi:CAAX protease family protein
MALSSVVPAVPTQAPSQRAQPGFIKRHPILTYYALTFAISWGALAVLMAGWTGIVPTEQLATSLRPVIFLITIAGPAIAGLVLTGLVDGKDGYRGFVARLRRWRIGVGWWAFAVLTGPLVFTLAVLLVGAGFGTGLPAIISTQDKLSMILLHAMSDVAVQNTFVSDMARPTHRFFSTLADSSIHGQGLNG